MTVTDLAQGFPQLAELLGRSLASRQTELQRLGVAPLWQVERDLQLLRRRVGMDQIRRAYRDNLKNAGRFVQVMYEIRVAAKLAPFTDDLELVPRVGAKQCDVRAQIHGRAIFFEVTTHRDNFPPAFDGEFHGRVTVERSFASPAAAESGLREVPASQELRDCIRAELGQLPRGEHCVVVVGNPNGHAWDMQSAVLGDPHLLWTQVDRQRDEVQVERHRNGLFSVPDEIGGTSKASAVVWMKLVPRFADLQFYGRLFVNRSAAAPLTREMEAVLQEIFDRRATLETELRRIRTVLVNEYHAERIVLFGSLADEMVRNIDRIHEWSDIDLLVVKSTGSKFVDRIGEVLRMVQPRVALNVLVLTPGELELGSERFFVRDEVLKRGLVLFP